MEIELWKPIIGFEDRYEVSNHGNVRGFWYGGYKMKEHGYTLQNPITKEKKSSK